MTNAIKTDKDGNRFIDMTPTWPEALRMCRAVIENGTAEGKASAWAELEKMALIAQWAVDQSNEPETDTLDKIVEESTIGCAK